MFFYRIDITCFSNASQRLDLLEMIRLARHIRVATWEKTLRLKFYVSKERLDSHVTSYGIESDEMKAKYGYFMYLCGWYIFREKER